MKSKALATTIRWIASFAATFLAAAFVFLSAGMASAATCPTYTNSSNFNILAAVTYYVDSSGNCSTADPGASKVLSAQLGAGYEGVRFAFFGSASGVTVTANTPTGFFNSPNLYNGTWLWNTGFDGTPTFTFSNGATFTFHAHFFSDSGNLNTITSASVTGFVPDPTPTLTFTTPTAASVDLGGATLTNAATSSIPAGGAISYASGTTAKATVNSSTGAIAPVATGTSVITATQAASAGVNAVGTQTYIVTVNPALVASQAAPSTSLTAGSGSGLPFTPVTASGGSGSYSYALYNAANTASATLGNGLSFNTSTGQITGTPVATASATTYTVRVTDTATAPTTATSTFSLTVSPVTYTVTYNGNANTGGAVPTDATAYSTGATVTVKANSGNLVKTGFTFAGWNTAANGSGASYTAGGTFTISANTTLYALWTAASYTVTYDGNGSTGGTAPVDTNSPYASGATVTVLGAGTLVQTGSSFAGWNTAANGSGTSYAAAATFAISANTTLYAQWTATGLVGRTWVSGVGDDSSDCSRTAPCQTFAGALAKTQPSGEINCLDQADFGPVTITMAVTIYCDTAQGAVVVSGTNAFTIAAGPTDQVTISGVDLNGQGVTGGTGIVFTSGGALLVRNSKIYGFASQGISFMPNTASSLYLDQVVLSENGTSGNTITGAIQVAPASGGTATVNLNKVRVLDNQNVGLRLDLIGSHSTAINATITDSQFINSGTGILMKARAANGTIAAMVSNSTLAGNGTAGAIGNGTPVIGEFAGNTITGNGFNTVGQASGVSALNGAMLFTYSTNLLDGNLDSTGAPSNGTFTGTITPP